MSAAFVAALIGAAVGCGPTAFHPRPPNVPTGPLPPIADLEPSVLSLPITIDLGAAFADLDRNAPRDFSYLPETAVHNGQPVRCGGRRDPVPGNSSCFQVVNQRDPLVITRYVVERSSLTGSVSGGDVQLSTLISYALRAAAQPPPWWENADCGCNGEPWCGQTREPRRQIEVTIASPLGISDQWQLRSSFADGLTVQPRNSCSLRFMNGLFTRDATQLVRDTVHGRIRLALESLDQRVASYDGLRVAAERAWRALHAPIPIGEGMWLVLGPTRISSSGLNGSGTTATTSITIEARPRIVAAREEVPIPDLPPYEHHEAARSGFHVALPIVMSWDPVVQRARQALARAWFRVGEGREVIVTGVELLRGDRQSVVRLDIDGALHGELYLAGVLSYDPNTEEVYFADLQYHLATTDLLSRIATWFRGDEILRALARVLRFPARDAITSARERLESAVNRSMPGVRLSGTVAALRVVSVASDNDGIRVLAVADGEASLTLTDAVAPP